MIKNSEKKTAAAKSSRKNTGIKKKRKKKLILKDGIRAALIAAGLICVTALVALSLMMANSATQSNLDETITLQEKEIPVQDLPPVIQNPPQERIPVIVPEKPKVPLSPQIEQKRPVEEKPVSTAPVSLPPEIIEKPEPKPVHKGTITLVMDDAGNNLHELNAFLAFPGHLTIAVLPGLPYSAEAARRVRAAGKELILHQPMEAIGGQNPGPGAIYTNMSNEEIRSVLEKNLAELGNVSGINNHQGSKVTSDERVMEIILSFCHDKGIYFLDSRTTADTAAPLVAGRRGTTIWERDVFLDNIQEKAAMIRSFHEGLAKAEKKGGAIMIGHVWSSELASTLEELYPEMIEMGFSLSDISRFMMGSAEYDDSWD